MDIENDIHFKYFWRLAKSSGKLDVNYGMAVVGFHQGGILMKTMLMFHYLPAPSSNPNLEDHSRSLLSLAQEKLILIYIMLFLKGAKNSLEKWLRILLFSPELSV